MFREGRILEYNKRSPRPEMAYIDYGVGALSASVLADYPADETIDLCDVYHALSLRGELAGLEVSERFYEIGSHQGLQETIKFFDKENDQ